MNPYEPPNSNTRAMIYGLIAGSVLSVSITNSIFMGMVLFSFLARVEVSVAFKLLIAINVTLATFAIGYASRAFEQKFKQ